MVGVSGDPGNTRRLPPWMLGATEELKTTDKIGGESDCNPEKELRSEACVSKFGKKRARSVTNKDKAISNEEESNVHQGSKKKQRKLESCLQEGEVGISDNSFVKKKTKQVRRKARDPARQRTREARSDDGGNKSGELSVSQSLADHSDEDLTADDLLSIAQEYVKEDEDSRRQRIRNQASVSVSKSPATTASIADKYKSGDSMAGTEKNTSSAAEHNPVHITRTGDAKQDMLDVFFGSLLKKHEQEKPPDIIKVDVEFGHDCKRQNEDETGVREVMQKKRSSLKDKVSLLLD